MMTNIFARLFLCFFLFYSVNTFADTNVYRIAINKTSYPYHFLNAQGQPDGLMVDYWRLWADSQGHQIEFVPSNWADTLTNVQTGKVDIHAGLAATKDRAKIFDFTPDFFEQEHFLFTHWSLKNVENIEQLAPYAIGVVKNSAHYRLLAERYPYLSVRLYDNRHAMYESAVAGEIKVFASLDIMAGNYPNKEVIKQQFPKLQRLIVDSSKYVGAVAKGRTDLLQTITKGLSQLKYNQVAEIEKKWLGYAKDKSKLLITYAPNLPPYMRLSSNGEAQGLFVDIWRLWARYSGQEIEFMPARLADGLQALSKEQVDIHAAFPAFDAEKNGFKNAYKIYQAQSRVFLHERFSDYRGIEDLTNKTIGVYENVQYQKSLDKRGIAMNLKQYRDIDSMFTAVHEGEIDGVLMSVDIAHEYIRTHHWANNYIEVDDFEVVTDLYSLVGIDNKVLANLVEFEFSQIPKKELVALENKWLFFNDQSYYKSGSRKVNLLPSQLEYINTTGPIKVGLLNNWFPIEFVNNQGEAQGIHADFADLLAERTGIKFEFVYFDKWGALLDAAKTKTIDVVLGMKPTVNREAYFGFSNSYWTMPWAIITKADAPQYTSLDELKGKRVGILGGYQLQSVFIEKYPSINMVSLDTNESGMRALKYGEIDVLVENIHVASELVKAEKLVELSVQILNELEVESGLIAVRNDWPQLLEIINLGIDTITTDDREKILSRWLAIEVEDGVDEYVMIRLFMQIGLIVILVIIFVFIWRARYKTELLKQKTLERHIHRLQTHDSSTGLPNRLALKQRFKQYTGNDQTGDTQAALMVIDIDDFKVQQESVSLFDTDKLIAAIGESLSECLRPNDVLSHLSADRFAILLGDVYSKDDVAFIIRKVRDILQNGIYFEQQHKSMRASIGVAMFPTDADTIEVLLGEAHKAMFEAKKLGKNHFAFASE